MSRFRRTSDGIAHWYFTPTSKILKCVLTSSVPPHPSSVQPNLPRSTNLYSMSNHQLAANCHSTPAPTVQPFWKDDTPGKSPTPAWILPKAQPPLTDASRLGFRR